MSKTEKAEAQVVEVQDPLQDEGRLKAMAGSNSDTFNTLIATQAAEALWSGNSTPEEKSQHMQAVVAGMMGIQPRDELEGMLAAQLFASHNAAMECYRRAMISSQTFEGRKENLNQANKLSRTYAALLEALNRHRGKGQQKVTVEHVHVHAGWQAVVGTIEHAGGGVLEKVEGQPHAITYAPGTPMRSQDEEREAVPLTSDGERAL